METRQQGQTMFTGILLLIGTVIIVQLWLVGASMDALLANETEILIPAAIISFLGLLMNACGARTQHAEKISGRDGVCPSTSSKHSPCHLPKRRGMPRLYLRSLCS